MTHPRPSRAWQQSPGAPGGSTQAPDASHTVPGGPGVPPIDAHSEAEAGNAAWWHRGTRSGARTQQTKPGVVVVVDVVVAVVVVVVELVVLLVVLVVLLLVVLVVGAPGQPFRTGFLALRKNGRLFVIWLSGPYCTQ